MINNDQATGIIIEEKLSKNPGDNNVRKYLRGKMIGKGNHYSIHTHISLYSISFYLSYSSRWFCKVLRNNQYRKQKTTSCQNNSQKHTH